MYILMNKNTEVAYFDRNPSIPGTYVLIKEVGRKPHGFTSITNWLLRRQAAKHRKHIRQLMQQCGCESLEGYIRILHGTSINDTFWVKDETESVKWEDVSLYANEFDKSITRLAFEGAGLYGQRFSSTTPEFSIEGNYAKCCEREGSTLFLIKRGSTGAANTGLEPYSESFASPIYEALVRDSVKYELIKYHGKIASKCELFTNEKVGYTPFGRINMDHSPDSILTYYESINSGDMFWDMIVADAVCFNQDRHGGNHGVTFDNDTLDVLGMAPAFDHNLTLLPYAMDRDFAQIEDYLLTVGPRIGESWIPLARALLHPETRVNLINLKGYSIPWSGDDKYSKQRAQIISNLINKQITAILA